MGWRAIHVHQCLRTPTDGILQQLRKLVIPVRDVLLLFCNGLNDIPQGRQTFVDLNSFKSPIFLLHLCLLQPFAAAKIAEVQFADDLTFPFFHLSCHVDREEHMASGALRIHRMCCDSTLFKSSMEHSLEFGLIHGGLFCQAFHLNTAGLVQSQTQHGVLTTLPIDGTQQINQIVVVELHHGSRDGHIITSQSRLPEDLADHSLRQAVASGSAVHGVSLSSASDAIAEDGDISPVKS
mmetsp:Transcript_61700/g.97806  ORF Transcript_61700/g.97806 Transcript_61700/m.97806 type:complete len:237 (+) Transcript_61700:320-1030(+)